MTERTDDRYLHGHDRSVVAQHAKRTAAEAAAFLLPELRPGMRVLDVGCGPGTITLGLAEKVAPGEVIGIDREAAIVESAQATARTKGLTNVRFLAASIYEPPSTLGRFDVVYAHQVLQHLAKPVDALARMRELLHDGGVAAVRDVDYGTRAVWPGDPTLDRFYEMYYAVARRNGAEPDAGRHLAHWLRQAGFRDARISSATWTYADSQATRDHGDSWATRVLESGLAVQALEYGLATRDELEGMAAAWRAWGRAPDAFFCFTHVAAIASR